jgi:adenylate kinase
MLNIIICGAPGSGKGTQSKMIVKKYNLKHLSTGYILRQEISKQTELGKIAHSYIAHGNLVPDEMIIEILINIIENETEKFNGIILDGFPRTVVQAEALEKIMESRNESTTVLLDLRVDREELISRLLKRGETSGRSDDNLETIKKRLEIYEQKTSPVNEFYKKIDKYSPVDGTGTVEEIFARLSAAIDARVSQQHNTHNIPA